MIDKLKVERDEEVKRTTVGEIGYIKPGSTSEGFDRGDT